MRGKSEKKKKTATLLGVFVHASKREKKKRNDVPSKALLFQGLSTLAKRQLLLCCSQ